MVSVIKASSSSGLLVSIGHSPLAISLKKSVSTGVFTITKKISYFTVVCDFEMYIHGMPDMLHGKNDIRVGLEVS